MAEDIEKAQEWKRLAVAGLEKDRADHRRAAAALTAVDPPTREQLDEITLHPSYKALLCAALAQAHQQKRELAELARLLNVRRYPPYHLVDRATAP